MYFDCNKLRERIIVKCGIQERRKNYGTAKTGFHNHYAEIFFVSIVQNI